MKLVDEGVWATRIGDGTIVNFRSMSTSGIGRWTIDIQGNSKLGEIKRSYRENHYEIKFK